MAALKTFLLTTSAVILCLTTAIGQQKKEVPPPPKPQDGGPSLEETMEFIQEKLTAKMIAPGKWKVEVTASPANCKFTHAMQTLAGTLTYSYDTSFLFREVEKIEVNPMQGEDAPPNAFTLRLLMTTQRSVYTVHKKIPKKGKPMIEDRYNGEFSADLTDEDTANRVAKAMLHAVELCGGGAKAEPF